MSDEERQLGLEERQFATLAMSGMDPGAAAIASGLVPAGTSPALAKKTAMQALGDSDVKAFVIDTFEEVGLTPKDLAETLKRNLTTKNYALHQMSGNKVELGDDGMTQLTAVKLAAQMTGMLGGSKPAASEQSQVPVLVQVNMPVRNIRTEPNEVVIDGDDNYSVSD